MQILSIETSCDDTAIALVKADKGQFFVRDEYVSSQTKTHAPFGGVVPNLAARDHLKNLPSLLKKIIAKNKIGQDNIDLIAVTEGPGLIPALLVGTNAAKALAYAWKKPLVGVNHIAGHIYSNFINQNTKYQIPNTGYQIQFPILALIVSGGHTELILMKKHMDFKIIGQTLDDAAGEAFDKVAKILGLGYPGGPAISILVEKYKKNIPPQRDPAKAVARYQIPDTRYQLPRPMLNSPNFNFSFSGLKTALLYTVRDHPEIPKNKKLTQEICAEFQQAAVDVLVSKTIRAAKKFKPKTILLGGGVSANPELRKQLGEKIKKEIPNTKYQIPDTRYSTDNAAMIAAAGYFKWKFSKNHKPFYNTWRTLEANANLRLK
ncbi:MAG: tRNA (adenosine(37)-N6)-threonylcarbamoyltransferase complex transferase subunit TsaD [Candidatus Moranbacteria bacterium]|nr:tRNA (adenosine(37)-N6)-threonylcarbamoyltransferase complex transferase subunit TsaD [Candidatus Moranbacteria bacterium]